MSKQIKRYGSLFLVVYAMVVHGQTPQEIISAVLKSQQSLRTISYRMLRKDTLVTGDIRTLSGMVQIKVDPNDSVFGFLFWAKEDNVSSQVVYNGRVTYQTDDERKVFTTLSPSSNPQEILYAPGGRMVMPDIVKLDTTKAHSYQLSADMDFYYLKIRYPDLTAYDVENRFKVVTIDKLSWLPVAVKHHQETLNKVQDLYYRAESIQLNAKSFQYDFARPGFLSSYHPKAFSREGEQKGIQIKGKTAPYFSLSTLDGKRVSSLELLGKVVLLDFWEVWCGPCIESMPKVQEMYNRLKDQGLVVFGVTHDLRQLESTRRFLLRKKEIKFPTLIGNNEVKKEYLLNEVPYYVLINKKGEISFLQRGTSDFKELEQAIWRELQTN